MKKRLSEVSWSPDPCLVYKYKTKLKFGNRGLSCKMALTALHVSKTSTDDMVLEQRSFQYKVLSNCYSILSAKEFKIRSCKRLLHHSIQGLLQEANHLSALVMKGINILVFKTGVKTAVLQGIQGFHQKKVHLLTRHVTG